MPSVTEAATAARIAISKYETAIKLYEDRIIALKRAGLTALVQEHEPKLAALKIDLQKFKQAMT